MLVLKRLPIVVTDIFEAGEWYEMKSPGTGLADAFDGEVESAIVRLPSTALHHRIRFLDVRRAPVERFPVYGIYYVVRDSAVIVIAVFHDRRSPSRIRARRKGAEADL